MMEPVSPRSSGSADRRNHRSLILSTVLVLLSVGGIGVMQYATDQALLYWVIMVPVFGVVATVRAWHPTTIRGGSHRALIRQQFLHWLGLLLTILLVFLMRDTEMVGGEAAGITALLALALTTFLAGVHFDWHFTVLGIVLGLTVAGGLMAEEFFWILLAPFLIALVVLVFVRRPSREKDVPPIRG